MAFELRTTALGEGNSLAALAFADAYFLERSVAGWTGANDVKESALIRATDYIDARFSARYTDELLAMEDIPVKLARACCEYALRALTIVLAPDPVIDDSGVHVVTVKSKLGPLEEAFQVLGNAIPQMLRAYPAADMLIAPYLKASQGRVIR